MDDFENVDDMKNKHNVKNVVNICNLENMEIAVAYGNIGRWCHGHMKI